MTARTCFSVSTFAAMLFLAGCAQRGPAMGQHMGPGMRGSHPGMANMCQMHQQMTAGKSPAEQQAAIEAHVKSMHGSATPEMVAPSSSDDGKPLLGGARFADAVGLHRGSRNHRRRDQ